MWCVISTPPKTLAAPAAANTHLHARTINKNFQKQQKSYDIEKLADGPS